MSRRKRYRSLLHTKNFLLISILGFFILLIFSGLLPLSSQVPKAPKAQPISLSLSCQAGSKVKAFVFWPPSEAYSGRYELLYRQAGKRNWNHLLATSSNLAALKELEAGVNYDFKVSFLSSQSQDTWAFTKNARTPNCELSSRTTY